MPATVIVGLQWGDEGKGKTTDFLAEDVTAVVRYQGGDNAGHTIMLGEEVFKLHLVPSGVLYPHITPIIGNGVVVNPATLISEIEMLSARGIETDRIRVSKHAHVIMPYHIALDGAMEARLASAAVGTTRRGIGPAYADRAWRIGIRMEDLLDGPVLRGQARPDSSREERHSPAPASRRRIRSRRTGGARGRVGDAPREAPRRYDAARPGAPGSRRAPVVRGRAGHAARPGSRQLSVRDVVQSDRRRRVHRRRHRPVAGRPKSWA